MCFRPAGIDMPDPVCPECGKKLTVVGGVVMKKCPFCKADLSKYEEEYKAQIAAASGAPAAPGAPGAPKPPAPPGAPSAPGAPKPPSAPAAPKPPSA